MASERCAFVTNEEDEVEEEEEEEEEKRVAPLEGERSRKRASEDASTAAAATATASAAGGPRRRRRRRDGKKKRRLAEAEEAEEEVAKTEASVYVVDTQVVDRRFFLWAELTAREYCIDLTLAVLTPIANCVHCRRDGDGDGDGGGGRGRGRRRRLPQQSSPPSSRGRCLNAEHRQRLLENQPEEVQNRVKRAEMALTADDDGGDVRFSVLEEGEDAICIVFSGIVHLQSAQVNYLWQDCQCTEIEATFSKKQVRVSFAGASTSTTTAVKLREATHSLIRQYLRTSSTATATTTTTTTRPRPTP